MTRPDLYVKTEGCWLWTGCVDPNGYGRATGNQWAHRAVYTKLVGPIPPGLVLDHLCRVPLCVNPAHLEPVTPAENRRRQAAAITHCAHGHPFDEVHTYIKANGNRMCRTCSIEGKREARRLARGDD